MAKHNKKRNVGLIHEQLVRYASEKIVEGKKKIAENAVSVLNKHFIEDTELYREFRLFNSLVHTRTSDKHIARRIIAESREACKVHDKKTLTAEKSKLIQSINHKIDENTFYNQRIENYRVFATVQALLNEWRGSAKLSPSEVVGYETVLEEWITRNDETPEMRKNPHADPLALKIMTEKFNKKYASFNKDQIQLLEYKLMGDDNKVVSQIDKIKNNAKSSLSKFYSTCENKTLNEKREIVERNITNLSSSADDETIKKSLIISHLIREMEESNE